MNINPQDRLRELTLFITNSEEAKGKLEKAIKKSKEEVYHILSDKVSAKLAEKDEPFGSVTLKEADVKITVTIPKKIDWDQDKLSTLAKQIEKDGGNPLDYLKIDYSVSEAAYKVWGPNIRTFFEPARTATPGNPSIRIEEAA